MDSTPRSGMNQEDVVRELLFVLFSTKRLILGTAALIFAATLVVAFFWPPRYEATGAFLVKGKNLDRNPGILENTLLKVEPITKEDLYSEVQIMTSNEVVRQTALKFVEETLGEKPAPEVKAQALSELIDYFKSQLAIEVLARSNVIELRLTGKDPQRIKVLLERLMNQYLTYRQTVHHPQMMNQFFEERVSGYMQEIDKKQQRLIELIRQVGAPDPGLELQQNLLLKSEFLRELQSLESSRIQAERDAEQIRLELNKGGVSLFAFLENMVIRDLSAKLEEQLVEQARVLQIFEEKSQAARDIEVRVNNLFRAMHKEASSILSSKENQAATIREKIRFLKEKVARLDQRNLDLKKLQLETDQVTRESKLLELSFETFFKRREEAHINSNNEAAGLYSQVMIVAAAKASSNPVFPNPRLMVPVGFVVALFTGISLGFLTHFFDQTVKRPEDCERGLALPVIFSIPLMEGPVTASESDSRQSLPDQPPRKRGGFPIGRGLLYACFLASLLLAWRYVLNPETPVKGPVGESSPLNVPAVPQPEVSAKPVLSRPDPVADSHAETAPGGSSTWWSVAEAEPVAQPVKSASPPPSRPVAAPKAPAGTASLALPPRLPTGVAPDGVFLQPAGGERTGRSP
ncbi:MAG: hypothetical protein HQL56_15930 [Magnetococcales bacterium]|nr:hypothetical protein [Magnetococcales bacterium]